MEKYRDYDKFVKCSKCELRAWCRGRTIGEGVDDYGTYGYY